MRKISLSIDDGCQSDIRVALLSEKYEIPTVFYWPVEWRSLAYENGYKPLNVLEAYNIATKHEVGSHTVTHRHLTKIDPLEAQIEITDSKFMLEAMFRQKITKFAPPRGYTNEELTVFTLKTYESQRLTRGDNLVHVHPNSGANENMDWREFATAKSKLFDEIELWGHSYDFDRFNMWEQLEGYLRENTSN